MVAHGYTLSSTYSACFGGSIERWGEGREDGNMNDFNEEFAPYLPGYLARG